MTFDEYIAELGFELVQSGRDGTSRYALRRHDYLVFWIHSFADGTIEVTWELELGAYLKAKGLHIAVQDELSLLLFPSGEVRGPADPDWLAEQISGAEERLKSVDLSTGG